MSVVSIQLVRPSRVCLEPHLSLPRVSSVVVTPKMEVVADGQTVATLDAFPLKVQVHGDVDKLVLGSCAPRASVMVARWAGMIDVQSGARVDVRMITPRSAAVSALLGVCAGAPRG